MGVEWGVLFELSEEEFQRLARFEGGYSRQTIEIDCVESTVRLSAETFVAKPDGADLLPTSQYLQLILDGAREHELPPDYQAQGWHSNIRVTDCGCLLPLPIAQSGAWSSNPTGRVSGLLLSWHSSGLFCHPVSLSLAGC
jgi:hypothetical protein